MSNSYMNKQYFDDLEKLSPSEIREVLVMEKMAEIVTNPAIDILNIIIFSGISFNDFRNYFLANLPKTNQAGKPALEVLLNFFKLMERNYNLENENFIKNPDHYEKL